jgi:predicted phosphoadenosine phosphosulfate sulfurtransferase
MNVHAAALARLHYLFDEFDRVVVSFSGGKDSGVMLKLALQVATERGQLAKLAVYHLDYEAQYEMTTEYVTRTFAALPADVTRYWTCLPIKAQCATSMFQSYWQPWLEADRDKWCRPMPEGVINEANFPFGFDYAVADYEYNVKFAKALAKENKTVFLIGIRTQESLHRYKAVNKFDGRNEYQGKRWTTVIGTGCVNAYPIYDWLVDDVWTANARFGWDYNRVYDLMHMAGLSPSQMRVASPFNDAAQDSLKLYKAIDPQNWARFIGRVNGVNFTGLYGGTTAMGWNSITKPSHFTWKQYMYFLLDTLPAETRENYLRKLKVSMAYWLETGGALPDDVVAELPAEIPHEKLGRPTNKRNYTKEYQVVRFKEYLDEIDIKDPNLLPTYKRMCIAIMKNDTSCKTLGFGQTKAEMDRRKAVIAKYQELL